MRAFCPSFLITAIVLTGSQAWAMAPAPLTRPRSAFIPGNDIPASQLHVKRQAIEDAWKRVQATPEGARIVASHRGLDPRAKVRARTIEWELLVEFNGEAADIWETILACHDGSAERARLAYFSGVSLCPESAAAAKEKARLVKFRESVRTYLETAALPYLFQATLLPVVHPLFVQAVLEDAATENRYYLVDPEVPRPAFEREAVRILSEAEKGLVESPTDPDPAPDRELKAAEEQERLSARRALNAAFLLTSMPSDRCASWGLWPKATGTIVGGPSALSKTLSFTMSLAYVRLGDACGRTPGWADGDGLPPTRGSVDEFRRLAKAYSQGSAP